MTQRERVQEYHWLIWDSVVYGRHDLLTVLEQFAQQIRQETVEEAQRVVEAEPELPGDMPAELFAAFREAAATRNAAEDYCRSLVIVSKRSIAQAIRHLKDAE